MMENKTQNQRFVVEEKSYKELLKKYPSAKQTILSKVEQYGKRFNRYPKSFDFNEGKIFIDEIKEFIYFVDSEVKDKEIINEKREVMKLKPIEEVEEKKEKKEKELTEEELSIFLKDNYPLIVKTLKKYGDLNEDFYPLIAVWILGTYFHNSFPTYPYLFLNAMKGSGKTRMLNLITYLSKNGEVINSLTEAVLFREQNCIGIDEFESIGRKGTDNLKELLNVAYKKGGKVKRAKKVKNILGETQKIETFDVYRPITMANISGMDDVLGDRCIDILLEKSQDSKITRRMETFELDENMSTLKKRLIPLEKVKRCRVKSVISIYQKWDKFIDSDFDDSKIRSEVEEVTMPTPLHTMHNYTPIHYNIYILFNNIYKEGFIGRDLELTLPLLILSYLIDEKLFFKTLKTLKKIVLNKKRDDILENKDISLFDFVSQEVENENFVSLKELNSKFKEFLQISDDETITSQWLGVALKRLSLIRKKERRNYGVCVVLDYKKAKDKMKMFRGKDEDENK